ncbi:MAG: hypothetical protein HQK63_05230 [Desulfamplus sp.]|nr:hypothetical protein [Desulfamplus sp.]
MCYSTKVFCDAGKTICSGRMEKGVDIVIGVGRKIYGMVGVNREVKLLGYLKLMVKQTH